MGQMVWDRSEMPRWTPPLDEEPGEGTYSHVDAKDVPFSVIVPDRPRPVSSSHTRPSPTTRALGKRVDEGSFTVAK